jgi:hypothetical protein
MGRRGGGLGLILGVVKAIDRSNKEAERERLRRQRAALAQTKVLERLQEQERKHRDKELLQSQIAQKKIDIERERKADCENRALEKEAIRLTKEEVRRSGAEVREIARKQKDAERNAVLLAKEAIAIELTEANAAFSERCKQRNNLRLEYLRTTLK